MKIRVLQFLAAAIVCVALFVQASEAPLNVIGAKTVTLDQAKKLHDAGATFIDVRGDSEWGWGHIQGASHLDLTAEFNQLYLPDTMDRSQPIVVYCNSVACHRSALAAFLAVSWGYNEVYYFREGYFTWMAADYPIETTVETQASAD